MQSGVKEAIPKIEEGVAAAVAELTAAQAIVLVGDDASAWAALQKVVRCA
jgi:hypothetical protein